MNNSLSINAEKYKRIFFLKDSDLLAIREAGAVIQHEMDTAYEEHYAWIENQFELQHIFTDDVFDEMEKVEKDNWDDLVLARVDEEYVQRQINLGRMFQGMGVPFEVYLASLIAFHEIFENLLVRYKLDTFQLLRSFKKIANVGISIVIDTYNDIVNEKMRNQNTALMEMSTPITQLWNGILLLPLVGIIDSNRAQDIMTTMLNKISDSQSKAFILDISGIAVLDTAVANYLIKITKATKLMGCLSIISGISGPVAQTIVELGIQIDEVDTTGTMQDALDKALRRTGARISKLELTE